MGYFYDTKILKQDLAIYVRIETHFHWLTNPDQGGNIEAEPKMICFLHGL